MKAQHTCPVWLGYFLASPLRKLLESPQRIFGDLVRPGMTVLEPGCGMGFFTLPLARMVGPNGRVVVVDMQEGMLAGLAKRARKAGLEGRIEARRCGPESLGLADLDGKMDLACLLYVVHEVPDQKGLFAQMRSALKPGGRLLVLEPKGHVTADAFAASDRLAQDQGLIRVDPVGVPGGMRALYQRPEE